MANKHEHRDPHEGHKGGSGFLLGFILGALFATLLTTKRGRQILRNLTDLGLELFEEFVEQKSQGKKTQENVKLEELKKEVEEEEIHEASEDIESGITEVEQSASASMQEEEINADEPEEVEKVEVKEEEVEKPKTNGNGHHKKRLFRGIRRK